MESATWYCNDDAALINTSIHRGVWTLDILVSQPLGFPMDNPEGVASLSPGLLYSATLGEGVQPRTSLVVGPTLKGLRPINKFNVPPPYLMSSVGHQGHNPLGLGSNPVRRPKVAEYSNLGL